MAGRHAWEGFFLILALTLVSCKSKDAAKTDAPADPPVLVETQRVTQTEADVYLTEVGTMSSPTFVNVTPQVNGKLVQAHFKEGDELKKGDILFSIDPQPFDASLKKAAATLAQNEATLALAKAKLERSRPLVPSGYLSKQDFDALEQAVKSNEGAVNASKADTVTAAINLEYCSIRSPIDGRTGLIKIHPGNIVSSSSSDVLVEMRGMDPLYVDFNVPSRELQEVLHAMNAGKLKLKLSRNGVTMEPQPGDLIFMNNAVDTATGTVSLRGIVPNPKRLFWPGQFVDVHLVLRVMPQALLVPQPAVRVGPDGDYVLTTGPGSIAQSNRVKVGQLQGDGLVVILEGLKPDDDVIVAGELGLKPGSKVKAKAKSP